MKQILKIKGHNVLRSLLMLRQITFEVTDACAVGCTDSEKSD